MNAAACYHYEVRLAAVGNGPLKPVWRPRANRKEIGWDGFVDRGGSMRIFGSVLPLIDRHHNCLFVCWLLQRLIHVPRLARRHFEPVAILGQQ